MELKEKNNEKIQVVVDISETLANALRRSVNEIPVLAIQECDIYKNDSALYDEIIAHRLGLIPLENQKIKESETIEIKLKAKAKSEPEYIQSAELGELSVHQNIPIVLLENGQEIEIVARAGIGRGIEHAKYSPGLMYYHNLAKIKIDKVAESNTELAEKYPNIFEFKNKLAVKDASACDIDQDDLEGIQGITITKDKGVVITIESWGQMSAKEIGEKSATALKENLNELKKAIK